MDYQEGGRKSAKENRILNYLNLYGERLLSKQHILTGKMHINSPPMPGNEGGCPSKQDMGKPDSGRNEDHKRNMGLNYWLRTIMLVQGVKLSLSRDVESEVHITIGSMLR